MRIEGIFAIFLMAACIFPAAADVQEQSASDHGTLIGMANPSAVWAEQMGYQYLIRTNPDGSQFGVCILRDRSEHDAWELFREYTGISRPGGISFIHPAPSMGSISSKVTGGQSPLGASPAALKP